jgi:hypothetical protein
MKSVNDMASREIVTKNRTNGTQSGRNTARSKSNSMKNNRVVQFALAGLLIALALQLAGYRLDHTAPRVTLQDMALYNWLTLLFSPLAFFLRLGDPEGPIVAGWKTSVAVLVSNAVIYAAFCGVCQAILMRLRVKLTYEKLPFAAQLHPERVIRVASPNWRHRRV